MCMKHVFCVERIQNLHQNLNSVFPFYIQVKKLGTCSVTGLRSLRVTSSHPFICFLVFMTRVLVNNATNQLKILTWCEKFLMISPSVLSTENIDVSFTVTIVLIYSHRRVQIRAFQ